MLMNYPQVLDGIAKVAKEALATAGHADVVVIVLPDAVSGTASVTWTHHGAFLKTVTIFMPVVPAGTLVSAQEFKNYAGFVCHEIWHPLLTDKRVWEKACKTGRNSLLNALEDVRIEKAAIKDGKVVPNALKVLSDLARTLDYACDKPSFDPNDPKMIGFVMGFLGRAANGYAIDAGIITRKLRAGGAVAKVLAWALPALDKCRSTQMCLNLADKIVAALPAKAKAPKVGPEGQKGKPTQGEQGGEQGEQPQGGEQGEQGETKGMQPGEGEGQQGEQGNEPKGEGKGEQQAPSEASSSNEAGEGEGEAGAGGASEEQAGSLDANDVAPVDLRPTSGKAIRPDTAEAYSTAQVINVIREMRQRAKDHIPAISDCGLVDHVNLYHGQIAPKAAKASRQRALLARAMRAEDIDGFDGGMRSGILDGRGLAKAASGDANVFGRRTLIEGYETDVVVLVDGSGSMSLNRNIDKATTMGLVIAQAAAQVGVACSVYMLGTCIGATGAYELSMVKEGKGKPDPRKFATMPVAHGGGTELCRNMLVLANRQVARAPQQRSVMFVVSRPRT